MKWFIRFANGVEAPMSTDALAVLLMDAQRVAMNMSHNERNARWGDYGSFYFNRPLSDAEFRALADIASERGVIVLPADHPLRTDEPNEEGNGESCHEKG